MSGIVEKELRLAPHENGSTFEHWYWREVHHLATAQVIGGAILSLGIRGEPWAMYRYHLDILSEAIEAAEALGL